MLETVTVLGQWDDQRRYSSLTVGPTVGEWQEEEEEDKLLTFVIPKLGKFEDLEKKAAYQLCGKVCHLRSLVGVEALKWTEVFSRNKSLKGSLRSLYISCPLKSGQLTSNGG